MSFKDYKSPFSFRVGSKDKSQHLYSTVASECSVLQLNTTCHSLTKLSFTLLLAVYLIITTRVISLKWDLFFWGGGGVRLSMNHVQISTIYR